jgi:hypothetical protein
MMPSESTNVFVSYSHADALLVSPVVKLLRVNKSLVFQDIDGIRPGKKWQGEIAKALAESNLVVVFWCTHASKSNEVSKEWQAAIDQKKDLLPLLLDTTPLPPELAEFQWIDFRGTVGANHTSLKPGRRRWLLLTGLVAVFGFLAFFGWFYSLKSVAYQTRIPPAVTPAPTPPLSQAATLDLVPKSLLLLGIALAVVVCIVRLLRKQLKSVASVETPAQHPRTIAQHIAGEVEAEILRRTTLKRANGR